MSLIELKNVCKYYQTGEEQVAALKHVDLSVEAGDFMAIMGPSGSGKSTLLHVFGGLSHPSEGEMFVDDISVYKLGGEKRADFRSSYIGFVFQSFHLLDHLTVAENVALPAFFSSHGDDRSSRTLAALARVGLKDLAARRPGSLSCGQKQRVAIARALFNRPPILLCDEPTGNLDSETGRDVIRFFRELHHDEGLTLLIVTHEERVSRVAQRVVRIVDGRIAPHETGSVELSAS